MKIKRPELCELMLQVAEKSFSSRRFSRPELRDLTEDALRKKGLWEPADDKMSKSVARKSTGLANIDWRITDLRKKGEIVPECHNTYRLASQQCPVDHAEPPARFKAEVTRYIRDTNRGRALKKKYGFACQVCGLKIQLPRGEAYIEVHHIRPLGGGHNGTDMESNMIVLCPNHHAMFDYGIPLFDSQHQVSIDGGKCPIAVKHSLSQDSILYHNTHCYRP
jgi:5-methylcytosine-specific restriction endonuclease McrA